MMYEPNESKQLKRNVRPQSKKKKKKNFPFFVNAFVNPELIKSHITKMRPSMFKAERKNNKRKETT